MDQIKEEKGDLTYYQSFDGGDLDDLVKEHLGSASGDKRQILLQQHFDENKTNSLLKINASMKSTMFSQKACCLGKTINLSMQTRSTL